MEKILILHSLCSRSALPWLFVENFWTHLDRGRSSPGTHPEPSSLLPPAPSQCCVESAPGEAAESLQTTGEENRVEVRENTDASENSLTEKLCGVENQTYSSEIIYCYFESD